MTWLELSVSVDQEAAESVSELLAQFGYNGGVVLEPPWSPGDEGPEFSYDDVPPVTLRTYLLVDEQTEATRQRLEQALWHLGQMRPIGPLQTRTLEDEDWANTWKEHYRVQRIGERAVIVPSWIEYEPQPNDVVLRLDPGMAFGTGLHPTTQLCVRLLQTYVPQPQAMHPALTVLDLGTGSGILAITAAKLGASSVLALDNDPIAIQATSENIERNAVQGQIVAQVGSLGAGQQMGHWLTGDWGPETAEQQTPPSTDPTQFDLIVANLIAKVLIILATDLAAALAPGGVLISSGIIVDKEDEVALTLAAAGLRQIERQREGEWIAFVHAKGDYA